MKRQPSPEQDFPSDIFDSGVFYRCDRIGDPEGYDTFRHFVYARYRHRKASRLMVHHVNCRKLYKWAMADPTHKKALEVCYAVFSSTAGASGTFMINSEGGLRVFLQRVFNRCRHHQMCDITFFYKAEQAEEAGAEADRFIEVRPAEITNRGHFV